MKFEFSGADVLDAVFTRLAHETACYEVLIELYNHPEKPFAVAAEWMRTDDLKTGEQRHRYDLERLAEAETFLTTTTLKVVEGSLATQLMHERAVLRKAERLLDSVYSVMRRHWRDEPAKDASGRLLRPTLFDRLEQLSRYDDSE